MRDLRSAMGLERGGQVAVSVIAMLSGSGEKRVLKGFPCFAGRGEFCVHIIFQQHCFLDAPPLPDYDLSGTLGVGSTSSLRLIRFLLGPEAKVCRGGRST